MKAHASATADLQDRTGPNTSASGTAVPAITTAGVAAAEGVAPGTSLPPVRLLVPRLELDVPVVEVGWDVVLQNGQWRSVWQTADAAAGHHYGTANPGEVGNVVLSGHHNTRGEVFRRLSEIGEPGAQIGLGDEVIVEVQDGRRYTYRIVQWERFSAQDTSDTERLRHRGYLATTSDATLTLVTCWPYDSNTHRVVIVAKLLP